LVLRALPVALLFASLMLGAVLVIALQYGEERRVPAAGPPFVVGGVHSVGAIFGENVLVLLLYALGALALPATRTWPPTARGPPR